MLKITKPTGEGRWFTYQEGVEIKVRPITTTVLKDINKKASTSRMELDPRKGRMAPVDDVDKDVFENELADYLIEDFKGIGDEAGSPLAATRENKRLILDQPLIRDFVWAAAQALESVAEEQVKN